MRFDDVFEPVDLLLVDGNFVRGVFGITEDSGSHTNQKSLFCNLSDELRGWLSVRIEEQFEVAFISVEFVDAFKI
jgi:hypothetical protein